jgi:hypothetical protein
MPDNEWGPEKPAMKDDFNNSDQAIDGGGRNEVSNRSMVTAAELQLLEKGRERPVLETHLTLGGTGEQEVHTQVAQQRETRIQHIKDRLEGSQRKLRKDFRDSSNNQSPSTPNLKDDFNRASSRGRTR